MGDITSITKDAIIGHMTGDAYSPSASVYLALFTADPTAAGTMTNEVTNSGTYARKPITFSPAGSRQIAQGAEIVFDMSTDDWGTSSKAITHWGVMNSNAYKGGNMLAFGSFDDPVTIVSGNALRIPSGEVVVNIHAGDGEGFTNYYVHKILDLIFRNQAYAQPSTHVALLKTNGADTDTTLTTAGKEAAWTGLVRIQINKAGGASPAWTAISNNSTENSVVINFATPAGTPSAIVALAIVDSGTANQGNVLAYDNDQVVDQTPKVGDDVRITAGQLKAYL